MKKTDVVDQILESKRKLFTVKEAGEAFAPTNIALCKYWGKRDDEINLPVTSSLSVSLGDKGARTLIREISDENDQIILNQKSINRETSFGQRLCAFLDLFRPTPKQRYRIETKMNIPVAAGLASSACGFAALILALNDLYDWQLDESSLSILARLGSGSAARSLWHGFVEWRRGVADHGMDSHGILLPEQWIELRIGLHLLNSGQKPLSSREAMRRTVRTSRLYSAWPDQVEEDMASLKHALAAKDFNRMGQVAEANALAMHATMMSAWPPVMYCQPETVAAMHRVWQLRSQGVDVYFTQDAGPNIKLLFLESNERIIQSAFPHLQICHPFNRGVRLG